MSAASFRVGTRRFIDREKFPYGFDRAGDFTVPESELLSQYGDTCKSLETGEIEAINAEEKHFLKVLKNPKKAQSKLERVWLKYIQLARGPRHYHSLNSRRAPFIAISDNDDIILDDVG